MKKCFQLFLCSIFLFSFQSETVPKWPTDINKTIAKLQPKFKTTSSKFKSITVNKSYVGGKPEHYHSESCPFLEPFVKEAYRKILTLTNLKSLRKFEVTLEVYVTESPKQALELKKQIGTIRYHTGTDSCPQNIIIYVPIAFFNFENIVIAMIGDENRNGNSDTFRKYADAFEAKMKNQ